MLDSETLLLFATLMNFCLVAILGVSCWREPRTAGRLLIVALVLVAINQFAICYYSLTRHLDPWLFRAMLPIRFSTFPLLYLYLRGLIEPNRRSAHVGWAHFVPFGAGVAWLTVALMMGSKWQTVEAAKYEIYAGAVLKAFIVIPYLVAMHGLVKKLKDGVKDVNSTMMDLRVQWATMILSMVYVAGAAAMIDILIGPDIDLTSYTPFITLVFTVVLIGAALKYSRIWQIEPKIVEGAKLSQTDLLRLAKRLFDLLREEKLYLNPQLRLADLSQALKQRDYRTSEVIKRGLQTNFYDLINGMRIDQAKRMLHDPASGHLSITGVALECGFNSKSAFNDLFKKSVGETPSSYRDKAVPRGILRPV
jgi:AraC-like DNA-binding protein